MEHEKIKERQVNKHKTLNDKLTQEKADTKQVV